jgi:NTP pyrophosphatase (non-canonical NTP hydrolase)
MTGKHYQTAVLRTAGNSNTDDLIKWMQAMKELGNDPGAIFMAAFGLAGESGEAVDHVKKAAFHGHALDKDKLLKEVGDIMWYCARMCAALGTDLDAVMEMNVQKLNARYPDGFSSAASLNRAA